MKKIKSFLALVLIAGLSLTSCSSDNNESPLGGDIMAKWNPSKTVIKVGSNTNTYNYNSNEAGCDKDFIQFAAANVLNRSVYVRNGDNVCQELPATAPATWTKSGNSLVIAGDDNYDGTYEITRLTGSDLTIKNEEVTSGVTTVTTIYFNKATN